MVSIQEGRIKMFSIPERKMNIQMTVVQNTKGKEFDVAFSKLRDSLTSTIGAYSAKLFLFNELSLESLFPKEAIVIEDEVRNDVSYEHLKKLWKIEKQLILLKIQFEKTRMEELTDMGDGSQNLYYKLEKVSENLRLNTTILVEKQKILERYFEMIEKTCCDDLIEKDLDIQIEKLEIVEKNVSKMIQYHVLCNNVVLLLHEMIAKENANIEKHLECFKDIIRYIDQLLCEFQERMHVKIGNDEMDITPNFNIEKPPQLEFPKDLYDRFVQLQGVVAETKNHPVFHRIQEIEQEMKKFFK